MKHESVTSIQSVYYVLQIVHFEKIHILYAVQLSDSNGQNRRLAEKEIDQLFFFDDKLVSEHQPIFRGAHTVVVRNGEQGLVDRLHRHDKAHPVGVLAGHLVRCLETSDRRTVSMVDHRHDAWVHAETTMLSS